jgi:hypothetical protein
VSGGTDRIGLPAGAFGDHRPGVRAAVAMAACRERYLGALLGLSRDSEVRVRRAATMSLGRLLAPPSRPARAARQLRRLALDRDEEIARRARRALVARGGLLDAGLMVEALAGPDAGLSRAALESLERIYRVEFGRPGLGLRPGPELIRRWRVWVRECRDLATHERWWLAAERRDSQLRGAAVLELVRDPGSGTRALARAAELAAAMASDSDARVRAPACAALHLLGRPGGAGRLLADLASRDWPSRYYAALAAAAVRTAKVATALAALLEDETSALRAAAHRSLVALRGEPGPAYDPDSPPPARRAARALWTKWAASLSISPEGDSGSEEK